MAETTATTFSIRPAVLAFGARVAMLVLVALLLISNVRSPWPWLWWLGMLLAGTISLVGPQHRFITRAGRIAEVAIAAIGGAMINEATGATIPYLVAPVFAAGIFVGLGTVVALIAWGIVVMTVAGWSAEVLDEPVYNLQALECIFIAAG
ncbi:MAG: hypothetical protein HOQ05_04815, partial [Corynebacteriales bacterium]|nr:hypothetical protein [Mycobacteriales bacterium]